MRIQIPARHQSARRGFTLMEVLLVLAILGVMMAITVPFLIGRQRIANIQATDITLKSLEGALDLYAQDHDGEYPQTQEGLAVLLTPSNNADTQWRGPYLKNQQELPADAWRNPIQYEYPSDKVSNKPGLWSFGPDKRDGTDDDVTNWKRNI